MFARGSSLILIKGLLKAHASETRNTEVLHPGLHGKLRWLPETQEGNHRSVNLGIRNCRDSFRLS